ncbi:MAG: FlgB family protein [Roseivivax sp.]|nr:FlgB family protein [Roseivivax sp.]
MFESLSLFATANAMARHAAQRQTLIARNMANSDTPGYQASDLPSFESLIQPAGDSAAMRASRPGHLDFRDTTLRADPVPRDSAMEPNGNTVSIEEEMVHSVAATRQHELALAIYRSGLTVLRTSLGRG